VKFGDGKTITLRHTLIVVAPYNMFDGKMIVNCAYIGMEKQGCWVGKKQCKTIDEFEKLILPYMEE
jgi:hypothetical protein